MILSMVALLFAVAVPDYLGAQAIMVTSLADSGPGSLRQAIADAPANGTIQFAVEGDIVLTSGELLIDKPLRIVGGRKRKITVRVGPGIFDSRVLEIAFGVGPVLISDLVIRDGNNSFFDDSGAGILNLGDLQLVRVTIQDNTSVAGAGLDNAVTGSTATLINCTISGNLAVDPGFCDGGVGAGIANRGTLNLNNTTISGNEAECTGGGIYMVTGTVSLHNTIIGNDDGFAECKNFSGQFISTGFNLDSDGTCGLDQPSDLPGVDPLLGPLQDNGGSTDTHLPLAGSPAIDAGDASAAPVRDQRGVKRPQGGSPDIGSVEVIVP